MGEFSRSRQPVILLMSIFGLTQGPLQCACTSFSQDEFSSVRDEFSRVRVSGRLAGPIMGWHPSPSFDPWGHVTPSHMWSGMSPWPQEQEKMWSAYLLFKQGSVVISCSEASGGDCLELLSLGPVYLLPQSQALEVCVMRGGGHTYALTLTCVDLSAEWMSGEGVLFIKS